MTYARAIDVGAALRVGAVLVGLTALTALVVHLAVADETRRQLDFGFGGVEPGLGTAAELFVNNVRVLAAVVVAAVAVQLGHDDAATGWARLGLRSMRGLCDALLLVGGAAHVLLFGAAYGAYGERTLAVTIGHAPGELIAFSLALALYLRARRGRADVRRFVASVALAVVALALAALVEAYA